MGKNRGKMGKTDPYLVVKSQTFPHFPPSFQLVEKLQAVYGMYRCFLWKTFDPGKTAEVLPAARAAGITAHSEALGAEQTALKYREGVTVGAANTLIVLTALAVLGVSIRLYQNGQLGAEGVLICTLSALSSFGPVVALANLGVDSTFFSVVPNNSLGKSAVRWLRSNDVHCTPMILTEPDETPSNRLGTYYLETGYGIRASKVIYDRKHSAITEYDFSQLDLDALLDGFNWLHLSGITPALGPNCRGLIIDMLKVAKKKGLTVSFDGNFRSTLWTWEEARDFCTECLPYVDVLLGIEPYHLWKDENDHSKGDWKDGVPLQPSYEQQDEIFQHFIARYPNLKCIARHVRYAHSGSENSLKAFMWYDGHTFESKLFTFNILDRVGGGDAFASGLIYAMLHNYKAMDMVNFAVASSAIKHTIHGDANITDDVSSIRNLMNMNYDIKR